MNYSHKMLLASSTTEPDSLFHHSLVYITAHTDRHTLGFIVNRESTTLLSELVKGTELDPDTAAAPKMTRPLLLGGPVSSMHISLMYQGVPAAPALAKIERGDRVYTAYDGDGDKTQAIKVTKTAEVTEKLLRDMLERPDPEVRYQLFMGHASWEPGQLDDEVKYDQWLVLDADPEIIFHPRTTKRREMAARSIDLNLGRWLPPLQHP
ncbi:MAG: YqgE/AlgH family protein [Betaproteobacteria bacterium AqS2]|uniref:YqgE/AlgH family protein n=1 Tax=Candidatus Amphirhobacter heronislandensis TaxID=1732024 RepID=A0A930XXR3_9GAMM|nr:YqgE/AlgH family protein [Betaproteobacteria bacterium AqS2]